MRTKHNGLLSVMIAFSLLISLLPAAARDAYAAGRDNITARADYLYGLKWTARKSLKGWKDSDANSYTEGKTYHIPYGQPVSSGKYVFYDASIDDFLAAADDASSEFYTERSSTVRRSSETNEEYYVYSTYYAMDCSAFVSYCWNLPRIVTTSDWAKKLPVQDLGKCNKDNVGKLQPGDMLNYAGSHMVLISRVENGTYEVTEQTTPETKRTRYKSSELVKKYGSYTIYRYELRDGVKPPTSAPELTVAAESEKACEGDIVIIPVTVSHNTGFSVLSVRVTFDASHLTLSGAYNTLSPDGSDDFSKTFSSPYIMTWRPDDGLYLGNDTIALLTFRVDSVPDSMRIPIGVEVIEVFDQNNSAVSFNSANGWIICEEKPSEPSPTAATGSTTAATEPNTTAAATTTSTTTTTTSTTTAATTTTTTSTTTTAAPTTTTSTATTTTTTTTASSEPENSANVIRLSGSDRIGTAAAISRNGWKSSKYAVIANGYSYADALAGTPLASAVGAPVLLTSGKDIESGVLTELKRLGAGTVYILGGTAVVSSKAEQTLKGSGMDTVRLSGKDRYETAQAIAKELAARTDGQFDELIFASAESFPDALSVSSAAAIQGNPILYMPKNGAAHSGTAEYAKSTGCKKAVILGGTAAISASGEDSLKQLGFTADRLSGKDRYETALAIYRRYDDIYYKGTLTIATGGNFPDALSGAAFASKIKAPVLLVGSSAGAEQIKYAGGRQAQTVYVFGGTGAVSDKVVDQLIKTK